MLITEPYRALNQQMHEECEAYGTSGYKNAGIIIQLAAGMRVEKLLDYGAGKCTLSNKLPHIVVRNYDPCIPALADPPEPHFFVVCTDVLEHIEPDCLDAVLQDLQRLTEGFLFATIAITPAEKTLPDGRNTHLIVEDEYFWMAAMFHYFDPCWISIDKRHCAFLVCKKGLDKDLLRKKPLS